MDYIPQLIGVRYDSNRFRTRLYNMEEELRKSGRISQDDSLVTACGMLADLKLPPTELDRGKSIFRSKQLISAALEDIRPIYNNEEALLIMSRNSGQLLHRMRACSISARNTNISPDTYRVSPIWRGAVRSEEVYLLPPYPGVHIDNAPFTPDLMYYLNITLQRLIEQSSNYFRENFLKIDDAGNTEYNHLIEGENGIKKRFWRKHDQGMHLDPLSFDAYKSLVTELSSVIFLRAQPFYDKFPEAILEEAFTPFVNFPGVDEAPAISGRQFPKKLNSPNQILEISLRMTVLAISCMIYDQQRYRHGDMNMYKKEIEDCSRENAQIYNTIANLPYEPKGAFAERHHVAAETAQGYCNMYREALGDLFKITTMCRFTNMDKRCNEMNRVLFFNRIFKIVECLDDVGQVERFIKWLNVPEEETISSLYSMVDNARVYIGTSASQVGHFLEAKRGYEHFAARVGEYSGQLKREPLKGDWRTREQRRADRHMSYRLDTIVGNFDGIVKSKRPNPVATSLILDAIMQRPEKAVKGNSWSFEI